MRVAGRIVLFGLATIGLIGLVIAAVFLSLGGRRDMLDRTRVVAVLPSPSGREAAVAYLHHISNFSVDVVAVALTTRPFPLLGGDAPVLREVIAVRHPKISGWQRERQAGDEVRGFIAMKWNDEMLDVCPASAATLVRFDRLDAAYDYDKVTLCSGTLR